MASEFRRLMPMKDELSHKSLGNSPECSRADPCIGIPARIGAGCPGFVRESQPPRSANGNQYSPVLSDEIGHSVPQTQIKNPRLTGV